MCAESEKTLAQESPAAENLKLPDIFGATEDDTSSLRIVSLYEVSSAPPLCRCQAMMKGTQLQRTHIRSA